jgi:UPF0176 protein
MLETVIPPALPKNNDNVGGNTSGDNQQNQHQQHYRVLALYKFVSPKIPKESLKDLQSEIETTCRDHYARGTLLLAEEGINGTICYPFNNGGEENNKNNDSDHNVEDDDPLLKFLQSKFHKSLRTRISYADRPIFARLKIKIKSEIVTMHWENQQQLQDNSTNVCCPTELVGTYVKPKEWNDLLLDPETMVIDTRNEYEIDVGTFRNAINPHTRSFVEFPDWMKQNLPVDNNNNSSKNKNDDDNQHGDGEQPNGKKLPKKIAMFCKFFECGDG